MRHKNESVFLPLQQINIKDCFMRLNNSVTKNSFSIRSLCVVGTILTFNTVIGALLMQLAYNFHFFQYCFLINACVFMSLLFKEIWYYKLKKYITPVWKFALILGLVFIPTLQRCNNFKMWILNLFYQ